jgi:Ni/Fe-hydrogenase 1 B-type cytochrome subunit
VLTLLLLSMIVQAATGLVLAGTDVYMPPFGGVMRDWVAGDTLDPTAVRPASRHWKRRRRAAIAG